jgi:hypothetical protein
MNNFDMSIGLSADGGDIEETDSGFGLTDTPVKATALNPPILAPIAFTTFTVQLNADYPVAGMTKDDFSVTLVPVELEITYLEVNNEGIRYLNVVAVDTSAKTITVKYGGAFSGTYDLVIKSTANGNIDTSAVQLKVVFELTDFQPRQGSIFGGTKLTLTGGPFSLDLKDMIVKVGYKWWEGIDHYCYVLSSTETELTCRLPLDLNREAKTYEVIAFDSTYEEANCEMNNMCKFEFLAADTLPEVTGPASVVFDEASQEYCIKIPTASVTDSASEIDFMIADKP